MKKKIIAFLVATLIVASVSGVYALNPRWMEKPVIMDESCLKENVKWMGIVDKAMGPPANQNESYFRDRFFFASLVQRCGV